MMKLPERNTPIYITTFLFALFISRYSGNELIAVLVFFGGGLFAVILEGLARKCPILQKYSAKTFLHEGSHYLAARALNLNPVFELGAPRVVLGTMPKTSVQQSIVALAPICCWWIGVLVAIGTHFAGRPFDLIGLSMLWPLSDIGCPGNQPDQGSDWEIASNSGSPGLNRGMLGVGIAIQVLGAICISFFSG